MIRNVEEISEVDCPISEREYMSPEKKEEKTEGLIRVNSVPMLYQGIAFTLVESNEQIAVQVPNLNTLVKVNGLRIRVHDQELGLIASDCGGSNNRAIIHTLQNDECVVCVVSTSTQRVFDVVISTKNNEVIIKNINEISKGGYFNRHLAGLGLGQSISVNQASFSYAGVTFVLMPTYDEGIVQVQTIEELIKTNALKIRLNGQEFELRQRDGGTSDRAIVRSAKGDQLVIRMVSIGMQRIFDISVSVENSNVMINGIKEIPKKEYTQELLNR